MSNFAIRTQNLQNSQIQKPSIPQQTASIEKTQTPSTPQVKSPSGLAGPSPTAQPNALKGVIAFDAAQQELNSLIDQTKPTQIQSQSQKLSLANAKPQQLLAINACDLQVAAQNLKKVSNHQILSLTETHASDSDYQSVSESSRSIRLNQAGSVFAPERLTANSTLELVGHGSIDGKLLGGKTAKQVASLLRDSGVKQLDTLHLKSCHSEDFAQAVKNELTALGIEVGTVKGFSSRIAIDRATGNTLVESSEQSLDQVDGHSGALGKTRKFGSDIKASHSRDLRKDIRALKSEGIHPWESVGHQPRVVQTKVVQVVDEVAEVEPQIVPATPSQKALAATSFNATLKDLGFNAYLSGGGALGFQGGTRPIDDLDFRIPHGMNGIGNFDDPQGQALLAALNDHNRNMREAGFKVGEFRPLGGGGLTIVCDNFCGVEVSISLSPKTQKFKSVEPPDLAEISELTSQPDTQAKKLMHEESTDVNVLGLKELQNDKLKSMISRWKWGEDNIKKTSQDLYDLLNAIVLDDPSKVKDSINRAVSERTDEYKIANPFYKRLDHIPDEALQKEIKAFVVLIAQEHRNGIRGEAFKNLCKLDHHSGAQIKKALDKVCSMEVDSQALHNIRPWVKEWRDRQGPTGQKMSVALPPNLTSKGVEQIMDESPELNKAVILNGVDTKRASSDNLIQVMTVLQDGDGFRTLADSKNSFQTQLAFGLSAPQFGKAFTALKAAGLVEGKEDGLHLSPAGRTRLGLKPLEPSEQNIVSD